MSRLHHPNIVQFLACVFNPYVCLVLELACEGSLCDVLGAETSKAKPPRIESLIRCVIAKH